MPTAELSAIWSVGAVPPPAPARPSLPGVPVVPRSRAALTVEVNATHESPTSLRMRFSSAVPCAMVRPAPERSPREAAPRAPACVIAATPMARCSPPHVVIRALTPVPTSAMACAVRRPHASALPVRLANCCTIRVMGPSGPESPSSSSFTAARKVRSPILSDSLNRSSAVAVSSVAGPSCCTVRMNASRRSCAVCDWPESAAISGPRRRSTSSSPPTMAENRRSDCISTDVPCICARRAAPWVMLLSCCWLRLTCAEAKCSARPATFSCETKRSEPACDCAKLTPSSRCTRWRRWNSARRSETCSMASMAPRAPSRMRSKP